MSYQRFLFAAAIVLMPAATLANDSDREQRINERSHASIIAILAQKGIHAESIEEWGGAIRIETRRPDGSNAAVLVDKTTLEPLQPTSGVATQLSVRSTHSGWPEGALRSTESLVEND